MENENKSTDEIVNLLLSKLKPKSNAECDEHARRNAEFMASSISTDLILRSGIPERHKNTTPDKTGMWWETCQRVLSGISKNKGRTIALVSNKRGTGKTQIGCEAIKHLCRLGFPCKFTTSMGILMQVRATYNGGAKTEIEIMAEYASPKLLVIDEYARHKENEFADSVFFHILNTRYNQMKETIIISNQSANEFTDSIGVSIASRMQETGGVIQCEWDSFRG